MIKTKIINFTLLLSSVIVSLIFTALKVIYDVKFLNPSTMQYADPKSNYLSIFLICFIVISCTIAIISFFVNKKSNIEFDYDNIFRIILICFLILAFIFSIIFLFFVSSTKNQFNSQPKITKIVAYISLISILLSIVFLAKKDTKMKSLGYILTIPLITLFISNYFSQVYVVNDKSRIIFSFLCIFSAFFIFNVIYEKNSNNPSKYTLPFALLTLIFGTLSIINDIVSIFVIKINISYILILDLIVIGYVICSYYYLIKKLNLGN